jgi:uncharacterized protein
MITIDFARTLYPADADSAHDFDHILRVLRMAGKIAQAEGANLEVVRVAALLHDIGLDQGRAGHETSAANRAREILRNLPEGSGMQDNLADNLAKGSGSSDNSPVQPSQGYTNQFIEAVAHAIEAHRFRSGPAPETLEAKVLFDADKLDSIGAIGIARAFAFGGWRGQKLWADVPIDYADPMDGRENDPRQHTAVHEYVVKLSKIKDRMQTETGKRIAYERHEFMVKFFVELEQEVKSEK